MKHINNEYGKRLTIDNLLTGKDADIWNKALSMEIGQLAKGNKHGVQFTKTISFINKEEVPSGEKVTYAQCVCDYRPLKPEPYRVQMVVGGDKLDCLIDSGAPTTNLTEFKMLVNSVISKAKNGARFLSCDLKDFFLASPMQYKKYMKLRYSIIPQDIVEQYNLDQKDADDGYVYIQINKGMYGLKEATIQAYDQLSKFLNDDGYHHVMGTGGLWKHKTKRTAFCLCVDDIGLKYYSQEDKEHFLETMKKNYNYYIDNKGKHYLGLTLNWNYDQNTSCSFLKG